VFGFIAIALPNVQELMCSLQHYCARWNHDAWGQEEMRTTGRWYAKFQVIFRLNKPLRYTQVVDVRIPALKSINIEDQLNLVLENDASKPITLTLPARTNLMLEVTYWSLPLNDQLGMYRISVWRFTEEFSLVRERKSPVPQKAIAGLVFNKFVARQLKGSKMYRPIAAPAHVDYAPKIKSQTQRTFDARAPELALLEALYRSDPSAFESIAIVNINTGKSHDYLVSGDYPVINAAACCTTTSLSTYCAHTLYGCCILIH
jgi:hypothetical protein